MIVQDITSLLKCHLKPTRTDVLSGVVKYRNLNISDFNNMHDCFVELAGGEGGGRERAVVALLCSHLIGCGPGPLANLASYFIVTCAARVDRTPS